MITIEHDVQPDRVVFRGVPEEPTRLGGLFGRDPVGTELAVDDWVGDDLSRCSAVGALRRFGDENPNAVEVRRSEIMASHRAVASLTAAQSGALGLPDRPPFSLRLDVGGLVGSPSFRLKTEWRMRRQPVVAERQGAFLRSEHGDFLIPEPMFSAIELATGFDPSGTDLSGHWSALARFRTIFDESADEQADLSDFLAGMQIFTAEALTLAVREGENGIEFDPILFDAQTIDEAADAGGQVTNGAGVLPADLLTAFQGDPRTGFSAFPSAKGSYLLGSNTYLVVDDDLEDALKVVREKQQGTPEERRGFASNPRAAIAERLAEKARAQDPDADPGEMTEAVDGQTRRLFVETPEYALRAVEVKLWEPPDLDFLPRLPTAWWPEQFAVEIAGKRLQLTPATATDLEKRLHEAAEAARPHVQFQGQNVPVTPEAREELSRQLGRLGREDSKPDTEETPSTPATRRKAGSVVADPMENFEREDWRPEIDPRLAVASDPEWPSRLRSSPYPHQLTCFRWLVESWAAGQPGVLNADDQGLGKTLETLAFLAWLQDDLAAPGAGERSHRGPILVVAPTGLLRTWEAEVDQHLGPSGLFAAHRVYGHHLNEHRTSDLPGVDTDDGRCRLHFDAIRDAVAGDRGYRHWLLTTYQTLTNYQHSFRQIYFSTVVFDEIQMVKNPATLRAVAAKSVSAEFRIGLTGTPIENRTTDLWAVMDALAPGRLGSLRDFASRYGKPAEGNMRELHARVFEPQRTRRGEQAPPLLMRRLKEDELEGLPKKSYQRYRREMPARQAEAYDQALTILRSGGLSAALKTLHRVRAVALHPDAPGSTTGTTESYVADSARLATIQELLDELWRRGERALLFIEDLEMQAFMAQWLRSRYGLRTVPVINGSTPINRRHAQVREFQKHDPESRQFAAFILSPRAAGFGITLTAATHVIHVSRWWNPAVEEQCNDRIYRIGQECDVTVHLPMAVHPEHGERSFDCVLDSLMDRKRAIARSVLWPPVDADGDLQQVWTDLLGEDSLGGATDVKSSESPDIAR